MQLICFAKYRGTGLGVSSMSATFGSVFSPLFIQLQYDAPWLTQVRLKHRKCLTVPDSTLHRGKYYNFVNLLSCWFVRLLNRMQLQWSSICTTNQCKATFPQKFIPLESKHLSTRYFLYNSLLGLPEKLSADRPERRNSGMTEPLLQWSIAFDAFPLGHSRTFLNV